MGTVVRTMAGDCVVLSWVCGVSDCLVIAGAVGLVVAGTNVVVVSAALATVVMSVFTLGAKVVVAPGPLSVAALLVPATADAAVVVVVVATAAATVGRAGVVFVVTASVSPASA